MNHNIHQCWDKAAKASAAYPSGNNSWETQVNFMEKFAELLISDTITEMCQQLHWAGDDQSNNPAFYKAIDKTLKHFGVNDEPTN